MVGRTGGRDWLQGAKRSRMHVCRSRSRGGGGVSILGRVSNDILIETMHLLRYSLCT